MKKVIITVFVLAAAVAIGQPQFGKLRSELVRIADQEPERFVTAIETTIAAHFAGKNAARILFVDSLKMNLGLDNYVDTQEKVEELERIRKLLENNFANGTELFNAIKIGAIPKAQITE